MDASGRCDDTLSGRVIGCAIEVHRILGPGLLEAAYEQALALELSKEGVRLLGRFSCRSPTKGKYWMLAIEWI